MSKRCYRMKKYRALKLLEVSETEGEVTSDNPIIIDNPRNNSRLESESPDNESNVAREEAQSRDKENECHESIRNEQAVDSSDENDMIDYSEERRESESDRESEVNDNIQVSQADRETTLTIKEKLISLASKHALTLRHNVLTDILLLLRSEGYVNLPRTAQTLLGNAQCENVQTMLSKKEIPGSYVYIGIENQLKKIISPDIYDETKISVLINVDGVQVFRSSNKQFWPIIMKVLHEKYDSEPCVVAMYLGVGKPQTASGFMSDFISESEILINNGIIIDGKKYKFRIAAVICDCPARAFLKCCKGHTGFNACERCTIKGVTVGKKRVYPEIDCPKRTQQSFRLQTDRNHHLPDLLSPLLKLPKFNIVKRVPLDSMHLLFLGVMKLLLEKWILTKSPQRIKTNSVRHLHLLMASLSSMIPREFQRKMYDVGDVSRWKATQYRFVLLYCGAIIFKYVLPADYYQHFLLLVASCRILCNEELAVLHADYANELLRKFVTLMPRLYGVNSQVLNVHSLIHLADDVKYFKLPLTEISSFWAENYLGKFKKLVRTPKNPLVQVVKRLSELDAQPKAKLKPTQHILDIVFKGGDVQKILIRSRVIESKYPNNTVQLKTGEIVIVKEIHKEQSQNTGEINYVMKVLPVIEMDDVFSLPDSSKKFGFFQLKKMADDLITVSVNEISRKCVDLKVENARYVITMLHI